MLAVRGCVVLSGLLWSSAPFAVHRIAGLRLCRGALFVRALFASPFTFFCAACLSAAVTGAYFGSCFGSLIGFCDAVTGGLPLLTFA